MTSPKNHRSALTVVPARYRSLMASIAALAPRPNQSIWGAGERPQTYGVETTAFARYFFDASLLFRCMDMLPVDRSDLARDDPLLFRELQGVCTL